MKCPKCGKVGSCRYLEKMKRTPSPNNEPMPRTDFRAKCNCGWEGVI